MTYNSTVSSFIVLKTSNFKGYYAYHSLNIIIPVRLISKLVVSQAFPPLKKALFNQYYSKNSHQTVFAKHFALDQLFLLDLLVFLWGLGVKNSFYN